MNKVIPRHSLIIAVGANDKNRDEIICATFDDHEVLTARKIALDLIGVADFNRLAGIIFPEMRHRAKMKLELGERVVINASNLKKEDRLSFAQIAVDMGVPVFYVLTAPDGASSVALGLWRSAQKDIYRGDGVAEVVDIGAHLSVVSNENPSDDELMQKWNGVTIIGDMHGMQQSMLSAISWARSFHNYIIFLGDVIDYGPQTLEVADAVYSLVMRGEAELLLGNHERKIARWIKHNDRGYTPVNLSEGNRVTTNALGQLSRKAANQWIGRFSGLVHHAQYTRALGPFILAHASIHPNIWAGTASRKDIETAALFGEFEAPQDGSSAYVARTYSWVEAIPEGRTVIVGHDIRRTTAPLVTPNEQGGRAVFLDTGCGKGGSLSSVDMRWTDGQMHMQNFNMY